jgi:hemoglobin/transferrin/lactoferrin receptor protein
VTVTGSWQRSFERRERQTRGSSTFIAEEDRVTSIGALAQAHTAAWHGWSLRYGADVYADAVRSSRSDRDTTTGATKAVRGLYPDGSSALAAAGFATANLEAQRRRTTSSLAHRSETCCEHDRRADLARSTPC